MVFGFFFSDEVAYIFLCSFRIKTFRTLLLFYFVTEILCHVSFDLVILFKFEDVSLIELAI